MKKPALILLLLALGGQVFPDDRPILSVTGTITEIREFTQIVELSDITFRHVLKTLTITTLDGDDDLMTPDHMTRVAFIGEIADGSLTAQVSTDNGVVNIAMGDVVVLTARPSVRDVGFDEPLLLFVATVESAQLEH